MKKILLALTIFFFLSSCSTWLAVEDLPEEPIYKLEYRPIYHNCKVMNCPLSGKIEEWKYVWVQSSG